MRRVETHVMGFLPQHALAILSVLVGCWYVQGGCAEGGSLKPDSPYVDRIEAELLLQKPKVARYLGISEDEISGFFPNRVAPLTREVAAEHGLHWRLVYPDEPRLLPSGQYEWRGVVGVYVGPQPGPSYRALFYYDAARAKWVLDIIEGGPDLRTSEDPIEPAPAWDPSNQ